MVNSAADIWVKVKSLMEQEMTAVAIDTWFGDVEAVALEDTKLILCVPTEFKLNIIRSKFLQTVEKAALFRGGQGKRGNRPVHPRFPSEVALLQNIGKQILHGEGSVLFHDPPEPQIPLTQKCYGFCQPRMPGFFQ